MPPAYEILLLNTAVPQIQAAQSGDTYVVPRDIAFSAALTLSAGTANGVAFLNGSKVLTTGSALTFDGTNLGVNSASPIDGGRFSVAFAGNTQNGIGLKDTADASGASFWGAYNSTGGFIGSLRRSSTDNALAINGNSYLAFQQNSTELMRLTTTGLGIGTSSPGAKLDITEPVTSTIGSSLGLNIQNNNSRNVGELFQIGMGNISPNKPMTVIGTVVTNGIFYGYGDIFFATRNVTTDTAPTERARITSGGDFRVKGAGTAGSTDAFQVSGSAPADAARLDSSGNLLVGTTSAGGSKFIVNSTGIAGAFYVTAASTTATEAVQVVKFDNDSTTAQVFQKFYINDGAAACGQINANGANTAAFGSTSDSRLKENIVDLPSQLLNIMALRPVEFDYIESEGGGHQIGFVAQEMQEVYSDTVSERKDGMLMITGWSKTEARLVKAIQEQQAMINELKAEVAALKGA